MSLLAKLISIVQMATHHDPLIAQEGTVVGGSYDASEGVVDVVIGDTYAQFDDDGNQPAVANALPLLTKAIGEQYGPVGGERVVLVPSQSGFRVLLEHGPDDSPGAPSGEHWIGHRNAAGAYDVTIKFTNDGATAGDKLGGVKHSGGSLFSFQTASGHKITCNDATGKVTVQSAGGHSLTLDDTAQAVIVKSASGHNVTLNDSTRKVTLGSAGGAIVEIDDALQHIKALTAGGMFTKLDDALQQIVVQAASGVKSIIDGANGVISHIAASVGLGAAYSGLSAARQAIAQTDVVQFESDLRDKRLDDLTKMATAISGALASASPPVTLSAASIVALIASLVHVPVPSGSGSVRISS